MMSNTYPSNNSTLGNVSSNYGGTEDDAKSRLMSMGNRKGISSEELFG
jgi:hypothetical protein